MRFLADENFPFDAVSALRDVGHDVLWIRESAPGIDDEKVLNWAETEECIVLTFDKDFGELAFHRKLPASCGIILFRIPAPSSLYVAHIAVLAIQSRTDWTGHFSVVEEKRIRMRPLPVQ
jgi:predicted nuclease of predicted toxin-antitoxin system